MAPTDIAKPLLGYIRQPGPDGAPYVSVPTRLVDLDMELPAGIALDVSLAQAIKARGLAGAYVRVANAPMSKLHYVIPALSPDDKHVAWYSKVYTPTMPAEITDAGIICGSYHDAPFYHCHGLLCDADGTTAMGHLLPETCIPSQPVRVVGFGFRDARFDRVADPQTGFELFVPKAVSIAPMNDSYDHQGMLLRISPNIEISVPLIEACQKAGWACATVHGVGSVIGAHFADNRVLNSFATEFLITSGTVDLRGATPLCTLEISLVGLDGDFMHGALKPASNPVLITSEIILKNQIPE